LLKLLVIIDYPVDLFAVFMTMVIGEFIDHKEENDKGNSQGDGESQGIDKGIKLISPQKSKGRFNVMSEHYCWVCENTPTNIAIPKAKRKSSELDYTSWIHYFR